MKHQNLDNEHSFVMKSPDTDVFMLLAYKHLMDDLHNDVLFETGISTRTELCIAF